MTFLDGLSHVWSGGRFLAARPRLWGWAALPALITVAMVVYAGWMSWSWTPWLLSHLWARPAAGVWMGLWNVVALFLVLWVFATSAILIFGVAGAFGAPFYDRLSLAVERELLPERAEPTWLQELWAVTRSILHSLCSAGLWVGLLLLLLLLEWIPVVGWVVSFVAGSMATGWFLAREMMDGPMSRRRFSYREKLRFVWSERWVTLGFGLGAALLLFVPVVNLLTLPIAIVGGTQLFVALETAAGGHSTNGVASSDVETES